MPYNTAELTVKRERMSTAEFFREYGTLVVLAVVLIINMLFTPNFFKLGTVWNIIIQSTTIILTAMGMTVVISTGGIDISVGSVMAIASMVSAKALGFGVFPCIVLALLVSCVCGLFNGFMVAKFKIQPIIVTLTMMMAGRGIAQVLNDAMILQFYSPAYSALGTYRIGGAIPVQLIFILVVVGVVLFLVKKTTFGRYIQAVGDNPMASRLAGVNTFRTILLVYMLCSMFAGLAGVIETAKISAADGNAIGRLAELDAIAAVAVGGTSMSGGKAKVMGTVIGALIMQLITISVNMNNIPFEFAQVIKSVIIILAVYLQREKSS